MIASLWILVLMASKAEDVPLHWRVGAVLVGIPMVGMLILVLVIWRDVRRTRRLNSDAALHDRATRVRAGRAGQDFPKVKGGGG